MVFTKNQKTAFRLLAMTKLIKRPMWIPEHMLGYCSRDKRNYKINVADDTGSDGVFWSVLIHELGHIYYNHMDIDNPKELKDVKNLCNSLGYNYSAIMLYYGGPMSFLNIAMDLECNTKLMTKENNDYLNAFLQKELGPDTKICTPDVYETVEMDTFRDYYVPLVEYFKKHENEMKITFVNPNMGDIGISIDDVMAGLGDEDEIQKLIEESGYEGGNDKDDKNKNKNLFFKLAVSSMSVYQNLDNRFPFFFH